MSSVMHSSLAREILTTRPREVAPDWSQDQWLERATKWWRVNIERARRSGLLLVLDSDNRVMVAGRITHVEKGTEGKKGRARIHVEPIRDFSQIGKVIRRWSSRNPVAYLPRIEVAD